MKRWNTSVYVNNNHADFWKFNEMKRCVPSAYLEEWTEGLKEDPITEHSRQNPKEDLITENPKEDPIIEDSEDVPVTEDSKEDPVTARTLSYFLLCQLLLNLSATV